MLFGAYLLETVLWLVATIAVSIWATRVYFHSLLALRIGKAGKKQKDAPKKRSDAPPVTILLPTYNESEVVDRLLAATTKIDYPSYDIIVADDSNDGRTMRSLKRWREKGKLSVVHRSQRSGFKAGALNNALKFMNPKTEYVLVLDADCVPPPDLIQRMVSRFSQGDADVVQGYSELSLNSSQNIFTRSQRVSSSSYYLVDVAARKELSGFIPIFGNAFMIKKSALSRAGGFDESSITEDWALASSLAELGSKVFFDETIVVPGECPARFGSIVKQQLRYSEGITRDTKNHVARLLRSKKATAMEKFDYLFYGFGAFNSTFGLLSIVLSAFAVLISMGVFESLGVDRGLILGLGLLGQFALFAVPVYLPLAFLFACSVALYREDKLRELPWCVSSLALNFIMIPVIVYGSFRGMVLKKGQWARTPKTGEITSNGSTKKFTSSTYSSL
jgi:cellulose synthase/poly-beta-1,6-N-acetylglucosamine synthase-like glycosyltransferase